jgi:hypothetical protein
MTKKKSISSQDDVVSWKAFSGSESERDNMQAWVEAQGYPNFKVVSQWKPKGEWGSYGFIFQTSQTKVDKLIQKEWLKKGCVVEREDAELS